MKTQRQKAIVKYQVGTYSGERVVYCNSDQDNDEVARKAEYEMRDHLVGFVLWHKDFRVQSREDYFGD